MGSGAEKFTPDDAAYGPLTLDAAVPSIATDELATPSESSAFQLIRPFVSDTATWPIVGPLLIAATKVKVAVRFETLPALSVAVIVYVWSPAASVGSGAEKFTPDDAV